MHTLLIAENLHQAQFIQKGLHYESLPAEIIALETPLEAMKQAFYRSDGIFLLIHDIAKAEKLIDSCSEHRKDIPVILLAQEFHLQLIDLLRRKKIRHFFTRPFPFRIMATEMRSFIFQQKECMTNMMLKVRELELNRDTHEVNFRGQTIRLRHKEFVLLEYLMMNVGRLLTRETILESDWDHNANIFTNTVDVHINKLRKKIDYTIEEKFIHTIPCSGYIFS